MKNSRLLAGSLLAVLLTARPADILPLDWVNYNGMVAVEGHLFWNQDWMSGPLMFDGTYTAFPQRYGPAVTSRFQPHPVGVRTFSLNLPDSNLVTTFFDYRRGDYFLDQIEVGGDFNSPRRQVTLRGFKKSYAGDRNQYVYPGGGLAPIQQSYLVEYASKKAEREVIVGVGKFISRSGMPDSSGNGRFDDDILAAGIQLLRHAGKGHLEMSFNQFLQQRRVLLSFQSDSTWHSLNRIHFKSRYGGINSWGLGLESDCQSLHQNSQLQTYSWTTVYLHRQLGGLTVALGYSLLNPRTQNRPFFQIAYRDQGPKLLFQVQSYYDHHPRHPRERGEGSKDSDTFDSWIRNQVTVKYKNRRLVVGVVLGAGKNTAALQKNSSVYSTLGVSSRWEFYRDWFLEGEVMAQLDTSRYSLGWDQLVNLGLQGSVVLFSGSLHLQGHLWGQGFLGPHENFAFDPFNQVPLTPPEGRTLHGDQWVLNTEVQGFISSVVISYRIYNLLNTLSSAIGAIPQSQRWLSTNGYYPPLGRMVYFEVAWRFKD